MPYFSHAFVTTTSAVMHYCFFNVTFYSIVSSTTGVMWAICTSIGPGVVSGLVFIAVVTLIVTIAVGSLLVRIYLNSVSRYC